MYYFVALTLFSSQVLGGYTGEHGTQAKPVVRADGFLEDTHEVSALRQHHLEALSHASHGELHRDHGDGHGHHVDNHATYHGPHAIPKVLPDGHIADTHEVHAAKAAHLAAVSEAKSHSHHGDHHDDYHHHHHDLHEDHHGNHHEAAYHGPLAKPLLLPSGHLADTHEVAAAKGAHLEALAHAHHH